MYDFFLGTKDAIAKDEKTFLLSVKRMLPRWVNSIPDSEFLAIVDLLDEHCAKPRPVLVETGVGASSLALLNHALKHDGVLWSWDFVAPKAAYLRGVAQDTLLQYWSRPLAPAWKLVPFDSLSPHLGLAILPDVAEQVDCCFLDSEHTLDTVIGELQALRPVLSDGAVVAIDDANYQFRHTNFAYINVQRRKLGLGELASPPDNLCDPFYVEVQRYLENHWTAVTHLPDTYKPAYRNDLFFAYNRAERDVMNAIGMERLSDLDHRFDAWQVRGCRP